MTIKTLRVTHDFHRVTRKVKSVDCSGKHQLLQYLFEQLDELT